jgi:hypothetical protein
VENDKLLKAAVKWAVSVGPRKAMGRLISKGWSVSLAEKVCTGRYANILRPQRAKDLAKEMSKDGFAQALQAS